MRNSFEKAPQNQPEDKPFERQVTSRHTSRVGGKSYDVYKLIEAAEKLPVEVVPITIFDEHKTEDSCWTDKKDNRLGPKHLLELADKYKGNFNAMLLANIDWAQHIISLRDAEYKKYPLLVTGESNVIDGMHRLTRAWIDEAKEIEIRRFQQLPKEAEREE